MHFETTLPQLTRGLLAGRLLLAMLAFQLSGCATMPEAAVPVGPVVAHHQHLISPAFAPIVGFGEIDGAALLRMMDEAGSQRAVILSMAYSFADERKGLPDPEALVSQENDWTARQVAIAPARLRGFCAVNPLTQGALAEITRCNQLPGMGGLKLHFGNSGVSLRDPAHVVRMRQVFALADKLRVPIVVHLRSRGGTPYGAEDARLFIEQLLPLTPNVAVQIAHLAGAGPGHGADADEALAQFVKAIREGDLRTRRLIFDVTTVASPDASLEDGALIARRLREIGLERIMFGSDLPVGGNPALAQSWQLFRKKVPLTESELTQVAANVAPYFKS